MSDQSDAIEIEHLAKTFAGGRVSVLADLNLHVAPHELVVLVSAANVGGSILALFIGATGVMNTSLLSFFERIREFGVLRALGWSRRRLITLVFGEALVVSLIGAALGVLVGFVAVEGLTRVGSLVGVFQPYYSTQIFVRALAFAFGMALLGALYPVVRAARLAPLKALQHE